jgi:hypothetical protein
MFHKNLVVGFQFPIFVLPNRHTQRGRFFWDKTELKPLNFKDMKTNTEVKSLSASSIAAIQEYIRHSEKYKNAYFFTPPSSASGRRAMEFEFIYEQEGIYLFFKLECSCKNIYITKASTIDDQKCNLLKLKNLLKKQSNEQPS